MNLPGFSAASALFRASSNYVSTSSVDSTRALLLAGIFDGPYSSWNFRYPQVSPWFILPTPRQENPFSHLCRSPFVWNPFKAVCECTLSCPGQSCCPGVHTCVDLSSDDYNCGTCGNVVGAFQKCIGGVPRHNHNCNCEWASDGSVLRQECPKDQFCMNGKCQTCDPKQGLPQYYCCNGKYGSKCCTCTQECTDNPEICRGRDCSNPDDFAVVNRPSKTYQPGAKGCTSC
jgi:hypothetical protein